jgi:two-component system, OmpR family, heavy metal sensor histidine kinase CusS
MKSIRRTLLLNVVLLLVVTLGVVSYVVYYTAVGALREKQRAARELVEVKYEDQRDEDLRNRAELLARDVQQNFQWDKWRTRWLAAEAAAVVSPLTPYGQAPWLVAMSQTIPNPITFWQNNRFAAELTLHEEDIYRDVSDSSPYEFIQMAAEWGATWSSRSVAAVPLGFDVAALRQQPGSAPRFETVLLPDGREVRQVVVKQPVTHYRWTGSFGPGRSGRKDDVPPPSRAVLGLGGAARPPNPRGPRADPVPPALGWPDRALPTFNLLCAWDTSPDNPILADKIQKRDEQLAIIDAETERSVSSLRATLAWTVAGAVAATLLGGWVLVGIGLFPLKRLSHAVSEINPKDFKLPLDPASLPAEVNPVAVRLSTALEQLQEVFEREKRAAADISHELRTPLAALTTTIEVARRKERSPEQYRQTLDECRAIAKQMSQLVERMLELAWLDAGAAEVRPERVVVGDLVGGIAAVARPLAEVQGLTFKVTVPNHLTVRTDPDKLREVVMNLTHNAIEYNRPGGEVEVTATSGPNGGVVVEVRDTGIGMAPEIQAKIFERFFRADPSRQATGVHAGLGLAIVKEYVDRLGGKLFVDSTVGRGSRFRVELPNAL